MQAATRSKGSAPPPERAAAGSDRFVGKQDVTEDSLKLETVGLVRLEDFQRKQEQIREEKERTDERAQALREKKKEARREKSRKAHSKLSFALDEGEEEEAVPLKRAKTDKGVKDPSVDTSFLPDREREEEEKKMRDALRDEWQAKQDAIKKETIHVTYSYWDGTGHRGQVACRKGDSIADFLEAVRKDVPVLKNVPSDTLMYVKEDLILPHHLTFYELLVNKARGKSGPLFHFDVHDDVRMLADASVEKDESHAGKVVERAWYNRHKHIFPASRWETYDPNATYGAQAGKDR